MEIITNFLYDYGYIALFITMALENMNIPIPSEIILGFAGFLISQQIFTFWPTSSSRRLPASRARFFPTGWDIRAGAPFS